jgi:acetolactate synthase-1/2/3 large subunit
VAALFPPERRVSVAPALSRPAEQAIDEAALLLTLAARPVLWAGGGAVAAGAPGAIAALAELLAAPVVTTVSGKGAIPEDHPLSLGSLFDSPEVARLLGAADAAVAVGTSFSARSTRRGQLPLPMQLIQIDVDTTGAGRRYPVRLAIEGDAAAVLLALARAVQVKAAGEAGAGTPAPRDPQVQAAVLAGVRQRARDGLAAAAGKAEAVLAALRRAIPADVVTVWDAATLRWAVPLFPVGVPGTFRAPPAGAPAGAGVQLAARLAAPGQAPAAVTVTTPEGLAAAGVVEAAGATLVIVSFEGTGWAGLWADPPASPPASPPALGELAEASGIGALEQVAGLGDLAGAVTRALARPGGTLVAVGSPGSSMGGALGTMGGLRGMGGEAP